MIKKGPKGILVPNSLFFRHRISMHPTIAPVKKATYNPTTISGNPKIKPIKNANLTSPKPIPFPRVTKNKNKKKSKAPSAERKWGSIKYCVLSSKYKIEINTAGKIILSGIIPYFKSAKNITIKLLTMNK